ncbi:ATP-dependent DNA helicase PcrA [Candidatus Termititenax persephonae]|uniref:DNA 3'-5' helicase n=1 Tax=Candidatus Termititenax persephonae TaxID=2218525 RepID=A0A388TI87_9BACT|nr:ATP-dependent DNA helicase PcrA [Candidatus Termititenax persephonae]
MLNSLNAKQKEAVLHTAGPLMIVAGAGSGKTRVLTTRIKYLLSEKNIFPERILAVTFTNKAAREMEERIGMRLPWIGTFHRVCGKFLRRHIQLLPGYSANYVIYDDNDQTALIKNISKELGLDQDKRLAPPKVLSLIGQAKNKMLSPQDYARLAEYDLQLSVAQLYQKYQAALHQNNAVDFDDMLLLTIEICQKNPDLLRRYQEQFEYILVDEYQDTNRAQYTLINLLAAQHRNLCVVGDSDQNIYSWRGADITNILNFEQDYPEAKIVLLEQNYRSTDCILSAANAVIKNNSLRKEKNLWTDKTGGDKCGFILTNSETEEAQYVADTIEQLRATYGSLNKFAVFYRVNAQSRVFEDAFNKRRIPYRLIGGTRFYARKEVKDILAYLRLIVNTQDTVSLRRIINLPTRGIGDKTLAQYEQLAAQTGLALFDALGAEHTELSSRSAQSVRAFQKLIKDWQALTLPLPELIETVIVKSGYRDMLTNSSDDADLERLDNIFELVSIARENINSSLPEFLEQISLLTDADTVKAEGDAVTLMSIHSAKGLEFPVVFLTGLEESILPHFRSLHDPAQLEEERRLCYVAITRAQEKLFLSAARIRSQAGETRCNETSRFVGEIPSELLDRQATDAHLFGQVASLESFVRHARPATQSNIPAYQVGDRIRHSKWGEGQVRKVFGSGEEQALDIQFERVRKSLLVKYAQLQKI